MSENRSGGDSTLLALLLGAAAGAAAGFLLAPRAGRETRRRLRRWLEDVEADLREDGLDETLQKGAAAVREKADSVRGKVESVIKDVLGRPDDDREPRG
jgi:gas vesicle protein